MTTMINDSTSEMYRQYLEKAFFSVIGNHYSDIAEAKRDLFLC